MEDIKEVAPEVPAQEQFVGKCEKCNKLNEITPPKVILPKFCMYCGKVISYSSSSTSLNVVNEPQ